MTAPAQRSRDTRLYWPVTLLFCLALAWAIMPEGFGFGVGIHAEVAAAQGSSIRRLQWLPLFALAATIVWIRRDVAFALVRHINPFLFAFLIWVAASVAWSGYPQVTLRKVVLLGGVCVIALAFQVAAWQPERMARLMRIVVTAFLIASALMALLWPHVGTAGPPDYAWVGATSQKNHLGQVAGIGVLLWLHALAARRVRVSLGLAALVFAAAVLMLTRSASSLAPVLLLAPIVWFMLRPPLATRHGVLTVLLAVFVVAVSLAFVYLVVYGVPGWRDLVRPFAHVLGRDVTLTGRLEIWHRVLVEAAKHPWLGQGFGAFWLGAGGPAPWVTQNLYGTLWQAHDGYLDLLNETGIIGLALGLGFLLFHLVRVAALAAYDRANAAAHVALIGFVIINNLTESSIFRPVDFLFFVSIIASVSLSRARADIAVKHAGGRTGPAAVLSAAPPP